MISVFTSTYNRAHTIHRVWDSLLAQSYTDFEWIVIDDGSADEIEAVIQQYRSKASFPIIFHKFEFNKGKHIATNKALELATRPFFVVADSDDAFTADALNVFYSNWEMLSSSQKETYCGIRACCQDQFGKRYSDIIPFEPLDCSMLEAFYIYKIKKETWCMVRTDLHRKFLFPEDHKDHFYPEGIIWQKMSKNHPLRFINNATRIYYVDTNNSISRVTLPSKKVLRNLIISYDVLSNQIKFFFYDPKYFLKCTLSYTSYAFFDKGVAREFKKLNNWNVRILFVLFLLPGFLYSLILKKKDANKQG